MEFRALRKNHPIEEFDYQLLLTYLSNYANKRDKITRLLKEEKIIRVKKGLYVFGPDYRKELISKEVLANLIYGPSYISYEYALSHYGMIPERVEVVTSATTGNTKNFTTPLGTFSYRSLPIEKYKTFTLAVISSNSSYLIATPEKALLDTLDSVRGLSPSIQTLLLEDLRIDETALKNLSLDKLKKAAQPFTHPNIVKLIPFLERLQS